MFEVDVKNVTKKGRGPAWVWGSDICFSPMMASFISH